MPEEPQELAANEWGTITYYPQWNTLELTWSPNTRSMGDDGFKETLQLLADQGQLVEGLAHCREAVRHQPGVVSLSWVPV